MERKVTAGLWRCALPLAALWIGCSSAQRVAAERTRLQPVKVLVINMFALEAKPFLDGLKLTEATRVPGLPADSAEIHCNAAEVCQITTGMGYANAASSISALVWSNLFDLTHAYFIVAGIAGIDPSQGTTGSAAWARYVVDYGLAQEIDARDLPPEWSTGYIGINTGKPGEKPKLDYGTEVYQLDEPLVRAVYALSRAVQLADSPEAAAYRTKFPLAPANQPPAVIQCDTASGDTWWAGTRLGKRAAEWTRLLTDGKGTYCTSQQEDNATLTALKRGASAGKLDLRRVAVLRSGSDFDRPSPGQSEVAGLIDYPAQGGFGPACENLYRAAAPVIDAIVHDWASWRSGVPSP
jgi:purine nucleoside permease